MRTILIEPSLEEVTALHPTRRAVAKAIVEGSEFAFDYIPRIADDLSVVHREMVAINAVTGEDHAYVDLPYADYLLTDEWREFRQGILLRHDGCCVVCARKATHCHHRTYVNIGWEADGDCVAICRGCHGRHHGKTTKGRRR